MGNVVVSEALKHATTQIMDGYAPTNASTAAGSYNSEATSIHNLEFWWRQSNEYSDIPLFNNSYDMPPDLYRFNLIDENSQVTHGATSDMATNQLAGQGYSHYYQNIAQKAGNRIINFYSGPDAALEGWEFNQFFRERTGSGLAIMHLC